MVVADSLGAAANEEANIGSGSLRITNGSDAHLVIISGGSSWLVKTAAATGNLEFARVSGAGAFVIPASAKIGAAGAITYGANDSGGAGYKLLRVAN